MKNKQYMKFCPEHYTEIENYEKAKADNFEGWVCHHRNGEYFSKDWLKKNNMYWNRKDPHEFIFVTRAEHVRIHHIGTTRSDATRMAISTANKGKTRSPFTEVHKERISKALTGRHLSDETRQRIKATHHHLKTKGSSGMHWYNDGVKNHVGYTCPEGFKEGRLV